MSLIWCEGFEYYPNNWFSFRQIYVFSKCLGPDFQSQLRVLKTQSIFSHHISRGDFLCDFQSAFLYNCICYQVREFFYFQTRSPLAREANFTISCSDKANLSLLWDRNVISRKELPPLVLYILPWNPYHNMPRILHFFLFYF